MCKCFPVNFRMFRSNLPCVCCLISLMHKAWQWWKEIYGSSETTNTFICLFGRIWRTNCSPQPVVKSLKNSLLSNDWLLLYSRPNYNRICRENVFLTWLTMTFRNSVLGWELFRHFKWQTCEYLKKTTSLCKKFCSNMIGLTFLEGWQNWTGALLG